MQIPLQGLDPARPNVLCLNSLQFNRDLAELIAHGRRFAYPTLSDQFLVDTQRQWTPPELQVQSLYVNYDGPAVDAAWQQSKMFASHIIESIKATGAPIAAVMAANWDYWHEEGFRLACRRLNLPFLVLLREHYLIADSLRENAEYFGQCKSIPRATAIAMAGPATRDMFDTLKLFPETPVRLTGWPRLDVWRRPTAPTHDRPIVLMSYYKGYGAERHFIETMLPLFADMARAHPGIPFIVKAKHLQERDELQKLTGPGVEVLDTLNLPALLCNARAVIGYNSAVMFEALLSPATLLAPFWGEAAQNLDRIAPAPDDPHFAGHITFAESPDALRRLIAKCIADNQAVDLAARRHLFGHYFTYTKDRTCVQRVEDFVAEFANPI